MSIICHLPEHMYRNRTIAEGMRSLRVEMRKEKSTGICVVASECEDWEQAKIEVFDNTRCLVTSLRLDGYRIQNGNGKDLGEIANGMCQFSYPVRGTVCIQNPKHIKTRITFDFEKVGPSHKDIEFWLHQPIEDIEAMQELLQEVIAIQNAKALLVKHGIVNTL